MRVGDRHPAPHGPGQAETPDHQAAARDPGAARGGTRQATPGRRCGPTGGSRALGHRASVRGARRAALGAPGVGARRQGYLVAKASRRWRVDRRRPPLEATAEIGDAGAPPGRRSRQTSRPRTARRMTATGRLLSSSTTQGAGRGRESAHRPAPWLDCVTGCSLRRRAGLRRRRGSSTVA